MKVSLIVPETCRDLRWRYLRTRNIVAAQFGRRAWANRFYQWAVRLDGRPETYVRVVANDAVRLLLPSPRFGPDIHYITIEGGGGAIIGGLQRDQLTSDDLTRCAIRFKAEPDGAWTFTGLHIGGVL